MRPLRPRHDLKPKVLARHLARLCHGPTACVRVCVCVQAHDDVLLEVPAEHWPKLQRVVERAMEEALPGYGLMLKADVAAGASWLECK